MLVDEFDALLVDLDGVVYVGGKAIAGAPETLAMLRQQGTQVVYLTNDPRSSRAEYARKLRSLGIVVEDGDILTSGSATAAAIREREQTSGRTAFVIGTGALKAEIEATGLRIVEDEAGRRAEFVVVGGHEGFNYQELRIASQAVTAGARFYGTNRDATFPMADGRWPAAGAILAAVETAAGRDATVVGKPEPPMFEAAAALLKRRRRVAVVGDSVDTDIVGGRRAGFATILVARAGETPPLSVEPDYVIASLRELLTPPG